MKLSIVIPIYNEEAILETEVERMVAQMQQVLPEISYELLLVENGSHDRTHAIAEELAKRHATIRAMHLPDAGYGPALKHGLLEATGDFVVLFNIDFWDVDFIRKALVLGQQHHLDMVVGSKTMQGAQDTRPLIRRAITRTFNLLLQSAFGFHGTDTHGMKLLRREKMVPVIQACKTQREIFDTEFVMRAQAAGLISEEIPVVCEERRKTTYNIAKRIPRTAKDLLVLFFSLPTPDHRKRTMAILFCSVLIFLITVLWGFPDSPSPWFDNGINLGIAKTFIQNGVYSLRLAPGQYVANRPLMISTNYPLLGWIILAFKLFGIGLAQAQIVMMLFASAFLVTAFLLLRKWYTAVAAGFGIALVVTFASFYGNGLSGGLGEIPGLLYFLLALLLLEKQKNSRIFFAGVCFGLAASTKVVYLMLVGGSLGLTELTLAIRYRTFPWKRWLLLILGAVGPLLVWLRTLLPAGFTSASIHQALAYYANPYAAQNTLLPNLMRFASEVTPIHFAILAIVFYLFFIFETRRRPLREGEIIIALFVILNWFFYLRTVGWYRYFFPAHITVLLLFPAAIDSLLQRVSWPRIKQYGSLLLISVLLLPQTVHLFFQRTDRIYYNPAPRQLAEHLDATWPAHTSVLVVDHPELWFLLSNKTVHQYLQMNPYVAFGEDIFATKNFPEFIISGEPKDNPYLAAHLAEFNKRYTRQSTFDAYVISQRKN